MGDDSADVPLLSTKHFASKRKQSILISFAKWVLISVMWVVFVLWVALMFFYPTEFVTYLFEKLIGVTDQSLFGITGSLLLAFSGPVFVIAFLAVLYLILSGDEEVEEKKSVKCPAFRLWTFPVLTDGPFGVVSAAELIGILLFAVFVIWAVSAYLVKDWSLLSQYQVSAYLKSSLMLELTGLRFGLIGLFCLAFLFLPVARGSILLRLIDIPFEHATRYHVWLGHLTMALFTFHGLFYVIAWVMQGELLKEILEWKDIGVANLAGVISLAAGLLMWVTSLPPVRKINFELFFYTHQLYVVFVVFLALHVGPFVFSIAAAGIFFFMLDRFLRFCQSRKPVDIISATSLPCGTLELVVSKPANLRYNALSFIFLQIRQLSWLEWHPFSVSSSPLDGKYHLSVLIKVLGQWTDKLKGNISSADSKPHKLLQPQLQSMITASVEGPYGHESPYHLTYRHLILVAGGIGISPFLAVLTDILHRIREGKPCLPRNILIVWAIKKSNELPLLSMLDMDSICPFFSDVLNLKIQIYITRETEPPLEEGNEAIDHPLVCPGPKGSAGISSLVGTGDNTWSGIYMIASTLGFITFLGLLDVYYINPYGISAWWYKGLLLVACMVAGVVIVGGLVVIFWHLWESRLIASEELDRNDAHVEATQSREETLEMKHWSEQSYISSTNIRYGCRPDFREIFGSIADGWGKVDVGVLVCGPPTLQSSVAREIRSYNLRRRKGNHPIFHFNSHSFDL